jgi:hypothetical protein
MDSAAAMTGEKSERSEEASEEEVRGGGTGRRRV